METAGQEKNGNRGLQLHRGDRYARFRQQRVEVTGPEFFKLDTDVQAAFAAMEDAAGNVPSRGVQEIREHRQRPWRVLARRFRECRDAGVPLHRVLAVVRVLELWARDLYEQPTPRDRAA